MADSRAEKCRHTREMFDRACEQGLAYVDGDEHRWRDGCGPQDVDWNRPRDEPTAAGRYRSCDRCLGCGKIANSDEGEPWTAWENLPLKNAAAVAMGLVKPIPCPDCLGLGDKVAADGVRKLKELGYTGDEVEAAWRSLFGNGGDSHG